MDRRDRHRARRLLTTVVAGGLVLAALGGVALATAGDLDQSFSTDGKRTLDVGYDGPARSVAVDGQGRAVVTGAATQFTLARFTPAGALDHSFSGDGKRTTSFPGGLGRGDLSGYASAIAIDRSGRIVAAGAVDTNPGELFAIARFLPDGSLDHTFSDDGRRLIKFPHLISVAMAATIDGHGRIVLAGTSAPDVAFARLLPDGSLDQSFSGDGKRLVSFESGGGVATDVAIWRGRIVAAAAPGSNRFGALRMLPNGALDDSFSGDGKQIVAVGPGHNYAAGIAVQGDGRVVAAGGNRSTMVLVRFRENGSLDPSFSHNGKRPVSMGNGTGANDVALQDDGRIVAAGLVSLDTGTGSKTSFVIVRLHPDGDLDDSFSGDGKRAVSFTGFQNASAFGLALRNGRATVAGEAHNGGEGSLHEVWAVARLLAG